MTRLHRFGGVSSFLALCLLFVCLNSFSSFPSTSSSLLSVSAARVPNVNHVVIEHKPTEAELAWLAKTEHTQEEKDAFLTAFEIATAISDAIEQKYDESLIPGHSFLEEYGLNLDDEFRLASEELNEWEEEARLSHHSFAEVAALHHTEVEAEVVARFQTMSLADIEADIDQELEWEWLDNTMNKAREVGTNMRARAARVGSAVNEGIQMVNRGVNAVGGVLDRAEEMTANGLKRVTKATGTQFLDGAIDAGVSAAFAAGPLGTFRAVQAGVNTAAAVSQGLKDNGLKGAMEAGKGALVNAASNYVMSKIPGGKVLEHAMSGPLGGMVKSMGKKALDTPMAKNLLAKSQKVMASKIMQTPLAKSLVNKVQQKSGELLKNGKEKALKFVNDKIEDKTGLNLNLSKGKGKLDLSKKGLIKAGKKAAKTIGRNAGSDFAEQMREQGQQTLDAQGQTSSADLSSLSGLGGKGKEKGKGGKNTKSGKGAAAGPKGAKGGKGKKGAAGKGKKGGAGKGKKGGVGKGKGKGKSKGAKGGKGKSKSGKGSKKGGAKGKSGSGSKKGKPSKKGKSSKGKSSKGKSPKGKSGGTKKGGRAGSKGKSKGKGKSGGGVKGNGSKKSAARGSKLSPAAKAKARAAAKGRAKAKGKANAKKPRGKAIKSARARPPKAKKGPAGKGKGKGKGKPKASGKKGGGKGKGKGKGKAKAGGKKGGSKKGAGKRPAAKKPKGGAKKRPAAKKKASPKKKKAPAKKRAPPKKKAAPKKKPQPKKKPPPKKKAPPKGKKKRFF